MKRFERARKLRFEHLPASMVGDYYFLNQEADGMSRSNVNKILRKAGKKAKVREEIRCSPHDCRHYFAQRQIKQGIDVYSLSRLLGHSNIDITTQYLRGLQMDDVLEIGRRTSPLRDIPIKLIWIKLRNMVQYSQTNNYITGGLRLEKTKKPIFKRWYFWVALIIVLGAVGAGMGEDKESAKGGAEKVATTTAGEVKSGGAEEKSKVAEEEAPKDYKIGDTAEIKNHNVSAVNVERKTSGNYDKAKDGHEFIVVNVKIENGGEKNISYNPMSFKIKTSSGNIVDQAITIVDSNTALSSGELAAGGTVEGTVSFEVPAGDQDLELIYSPNPFTDDSVIIKLQ
ncbi:DUF4352 domain-containing protein [Bacillus aquiflavi]|nr:DUF4352 domain-containing protein [Bacillus aquiflavi]